VFHDCPPFVRIFLFLVLEILTVLAAKAVVFWALMSCSLLEAYRRLRRMGQSDPLKCQYSSVIRVDEFIYPDDGDSRIR
jgi:hypothetical protein